MRQLQSRDVSSEVKKQNAVFYDFDVALCGFSIPGNLTFCHHDNKSL